MVAKQIKVEWFPQTITPLGCFCVFNCLTIVCVPPWMCVTYDSTHQYEPRFGVSTSFLWCIDVEANISRRHDYFFLYDFNIYIYIYSIYIYIQYI